MVKSLLCESAGDTYQLTSYGDGPVSEGENAVPKLPDKLITKILSYLPVEPLLRFKSVSKPWCSLIESPQFVKIHLKEALVRKTNLGIIIRKGNFCNYDSAVFDSLHDATATGIEQNVRTRVDHKYIVGNCNGLLCMMHFTIKHVLWNPATRKIHELPAAPVDIPPVSSIRTGFGYDLLNDDYKVVVFVQPEANAEVLGGKVHVYSLKTNSWNRMKDLPYLEFQDPKGIFASGALHWVTTKAHKSISCPSIFAYDFVDDKFYLIPLPNIMIETSGITLGVLGGCLTLLGNKPNEPLNVWVMKEYGRKKFWSKLFSVKQLQVIGSSCVPRPLIYSNSGTDVLLEVDKSRETKIVCFDLERSTVKDVVNLRGFPRVFHVEVYQQTLVQLNRDPKSDGKPLKETEKQKKIEMRSFLSKGFKLVL